MGFIRKSRLEAAKQRAYDAGYADAKTVLEAMHAAEVDGFKAALRHTGEERDLAAAALAKTRRWINNLITGDPDDPDDDYPETAGTGVSLVKRGAA